MTSLHGWVRGLALLALTVLGAAARADDAANPESCFEASAVRYGLDARLLRAIARVESGMNPRAMNLTHRAQTGTVDIGLMQINSGWLPTLARYGIGRADLQRDCTNIDVGAWILAGVVARHGNQWQAVGAYNAACTKLKGDACTAQRAAYAWRVYRRLDHPRAVAGTAARQGAAFAARPHPAGAVSNPAALQIVSLGAPQS